MRRFRMFTTTRQILSNNKVVPAFNFSTAEVARAIVETCERLGQCVILQTSMNEAKFLGLEVAVGIAKALGHGSKISVSLHFDHARNLEIIKAALAVGYTSVLVDGSSMSFEESVDFVKGIRGTKGVNNEEIIVEASLTKFERAAEFVEKTKPDLLAPFTIVALGVTPKGVTTEDVSEIDKIRLVRKFVNTPLVLHDGSSKSDKEIKEAIANGVVKVNWNTCLREAWSKTLRQTLGSHPDEIKPYNILRESVEAVKKAVTTLVVMLQK